MNGKSDILNSDGEKLMRTLLNRMILSFMAIIIINQTSNAYDNKITHKYINIKALEKSSFDRTLKNSLGISNGISDKVNGKTIQKWIVEGKEQEDEPNWRCLRHFHDPVMSEDRRLPLTYYIYFSKDDHGIWKIEK